MDDSMFLSMVIGVGVIVLVGGVGLVMSGSFGKLAEQRLEGLTGGRAETDRGAARQRHPAAALGHQPRRRLALGQARPQRREPQPALRAGRREPHVQLVHGPRDRAWAVGAGRRPRSSSLPIYALPLAAGFLAALPFLWLLKRKQKRIKKFVEAMPEAVELIGRALRAGHGLASGCTSWPRR